MLARKLLMIISLISLVLLSGACATAHKAVMDDPAAAEGPDLDTLPLGDPELSDKFIDLKIGDVYDAKTGEKITFEQMIERMAPAKVVYLGESHTSMEIHKMQDRVIRGLYGKNYDLKIGMEFFYRENEADLKEWSAGYLTERGLMYKVGWYAGGGGYNFGYYRPFIGFAREKNIPVFGINIPRSILRVISSQGYDKLTPEQAEMVGEINTENPGHRTLIMDHYFGGAAAGPMGHSNPERMERIYSGQCAWDNVFADSTLSALEGFDGKVVIIVGSGHVSYSLGTNRRLLEKKELPITTVMPVHVNNGISQKVVRSVGDFIVGVSYDVDPEYYPSFGLPLSQKDDGVTVGSFRFSPKAYAKTAGFEEGDIVTAFNGLKVTDVTDLKMRLANTAYGEKITLTVTRGEGSFDFEMMLEK
jgi:uncharacterized iron-regulated protein